MRLIEPVGLEERSPTPFRRPTPPDRPIPLGRHNAMQVPRTSRPADLLTFARALQRRHEAATPVESRKGRGQVFTPVGICRSMAGLFTWIPDRARLLDAGAGIGSPAAAFRERVLTLPTPRRVDLTLYESDLTLRSLLEQNMRHCRSALADGGHEMRFPIRGEDFILNGRVPRNRRDLFDAGDPEGEFDAVIMNPPYFKAGSDPAHVTAMSEVFQGRSNISAMFMARAVELSRPNGEMVAITPRSYCNGLYFQGFQTTVLLANGPSSRPSVRLPPRHVRGRLARKLGLMPAFR